MFNPKCSICNGTGKVADSHQCSPCNLCKGSGYVLLQNKCYQCGGRKKLSVKLTCNVYKGNKYYNYTCK